VATIDVEKTETIKHVQVVGDFFMYGQNYIYEPVYYSTPVIYASLTPNYRPYYPTWNWGIIRLIIMLGIHSQFSDIETTSIYA
jgi:hypothetical protein